MMTLKNLSIAEVVFDLPLDGPFDYEIPERLKGRVFIGQRVSVVFNRKKRLGFVTGLKAQSDCSQLNWVLAIMDEGSPAIDDAAMTLAGKMAAYYGCSLGQALACGLPPLVRQNRDLMSMVDEHRGDNYVLSTPILLHDLDEDCSRNWILGRITKVLEAQRTVLVLVPEARDVMGMKNWLSAELERPVFAVGKKFPVAKAKQEWQSVRSGEYTVCVGTRSAVFTRLPRLGLIIVTQEEHASYQEEQMPHYKVREVVLMRRAVDYCDVIFWSEAPSVEVWHDMLGGKLEKICFSGAMADFRVIDMSNYNPRKSSLLASPVQNQLKECLDANGRALFIVQSRDFQSWTHPHDGQAVRAKADKIEDEIRRFYGAYRFERWDDESKLSVKPRGQIVLAPPSILKTRRLWQPDLIGVIRPDAQMHQFDYRASQRVFAFFVRLRLWAKKVVMIQTMLRDQCSIVAAEKGDFEYFYHEELRSREDLELPPVRHRVNIHCRGLDARKVEGYAEQVFQNLSAQLPNPQDIQPPYCKEGARSAEKNLRIIILKGDSVEILIRDIKACLARVKKPHNVLVTLSVDN